MACGDPGSAGRHGAGARACASPRPRRAKPRRVYGLSLAAVRQLSLRYWLVVALGAVFTLARFSEAFLILRAQDVGLAIGYVPLIMVVMNAVYAAFAYPAGAAADAPGHRARCSCPGWSF